MKYINSLIKQLLLPLVLLAGSIKASQAQITVSIGPRLGVNFANVRYSDPKAFYNYSTATVSGVEVGGIASLNRRHLQLQTGLLYSRKGFVLNGHLESVSSSGTSFYNVAVSHEFDYLSIPLTVAYTQHSNGKGWQLLAGGYLNTLVGGRAAYDNSQGVTGVTLSRYQAERAVVAGNSFLTNDTFYSRRLNAGLNLGVGYRYGDFIGQASYGLGLTNLGADYPMNSSPEGPVYYDRSFTVSIAYLVRLTAER